jgi:hypothetical protein
MINRNESCRACRKPVADIAGTDIEMPLLDVATVTTEKL